MVDFANRVEKISISGIRRVFEAAGGDAINLGLGQPDFQAPQHVHEAAIDAIRSGKVDGYSNNRGIDPLLHALGERYRSRLNCDIDAESFIVTAGASEALHIALQAHVEPEDEVLVPDPGFVSYPALASLAGAIPKGVELREDLTLDPAAVEEAITESTAAFVVNSPANPTGAVQSEADMRAFAEIADDHDILCISDEVYEEIIFEGTHHSPFTFSETDNVIVVNACSKTYSMTGWRLGWVLASQRRIERMLRPHQYIQACASVPAQYAALAALTGPQTRVGEMVQTFEKRRDLLLAGFEEIGLDAATPRGAFYVMPSVPEGWVDAMLDRGVIVVPGDAFGEKGTGYARISYATDTDSIKEAIEVMREVTLTTS